MTNKNNRSKDAADLRQKAEALAREQANQSSQDSADLSPEEIRETLHELRVHQIELEMQNEELRTAQAEIEAGRRPPHLETGDLTAVRDFTDVRDMVRAYRLAADKGRAGVAYNVCSGRAYTIREVLERLLKLSDCRIEIRQSEGRMRRTDVPIFRGDPSRFSAATGWRTEYDIDRTLETILDYWRKRLKLNRVEP